MTNSIRLEKYQFIRVNYFDTFKYGLNSIDTNQVSPVIFTQVAKQLSTDSFMLVEITGFEEYGGFDYLNKAFFIADHKSNKIRITEDTNNPKFESVRIANRYLSNPVAITKEATTSDSSSKHRFDFAAVALSIVKIDHSKKKVLIEAYHW